MKIGYTHNNNARYSNRVFKNTEVDAKSDKTNREISSTPEIPDVEDYFVEISNENDKKISDASDEMQKISDRLKEFKKRLDEANEQSANAAEGWKIYLRCMQIARNIMSGNTVPKADHRYLAKHDPELYSKALTLRVEKEEPKKLKKVSSEKKSDKKDAKEAKTDDRPTQMKIQEAIAGEPIPGSTE